MYNRKNNTLVQLINAFEKRIRIQLNHRLLLLLLEHIFQAKYIYIQIERYIYIYYIHLGMYMYVNVCIYVNCCCCCCCGSIADKDMQRSSFLFFKSSVPNELLKNMFFLVQSKVTPTPAIAFQRFMMRISSSCERYVCVCVCFSFVYDFIFSNSICRQSPNRHRRISCKTNHVGL